MIDWLADFFRRNQELAEGSNFFDFFTQTFNGTAQFNTYHKDIEKLRAVFGNPALLKVITLQCDLFSLGKVYVYKGEKELPNDPFLKMIANPNPFQGRSQWLWDYMFWTMIGNAYCSIDSKAVKEGNKLYFLSPDKMYFPIEFQQAQDKMILSSASQTALEKLNITYRFQDGTTTSIPWGNIVHVADLTNGSGNWFKGNSRIDALYKVISNSEQALDSQNINLRYSGKFLVAGMSDPENVDQMPLSEPEKQDIERKMNGRKKVMAVKTMIDIKRFVENLGQLQLPEAYLNSYFIIGSEYGIPKDVLEGYLSSTYENQEKARGAHVSYCLQPKGNELMNKLANFFGYTDKEIHIDWEHLPFMQVFAKDRATVNQTISQTILNLQKAGVSEDDINRFLDTNFKNLKPISSDVKEPQQQEPTAGASNMPQGGQTEAGQGNESQGQAN